MMLKRLKLAHRFSLLLALVFLTSTIIAGIVASTVLERQAEKIFLLKAGYLWKL